MDLVLRASAIFIIVWLMTRLVGRRELSTMQPFDVILLVVVGDLVGQGAMQSDNSLTGAVIVVSTMSLLAVAFSYASFKFPRLRPALDGEPLVLIQDGKLIERNLRRERISIVELAAAARLHDVGDLSTVRFAVLETNGTISFIAQ